MSEKEKEFRFEDAFVRLEAILEELNRGSVALDESLKLYEEADRLLRLCNQKLCHAEKRIEKLVKDREGNVALDEMGKPKTEEFDVGESS